MAKWEVCLITHTASNNPDKVRAKVEYSTGERRAPEGKDASLATLLANHYDEGWEFVASATTSVEETTYWVMRRPHRPTAEEAKAESEENSRRLWEDMSPEAKESIRKLLDKYKKETGTSLG